MTKSQIRDRVLRFFRAKYRYVEFTTDMRKHLLLADQQILDIATALAMEIGCNPSTTAIGKCKTVGDLAKLLADTKIRVRIHDVI